MPFVSGTGFDQLADIFDRTLKWARGRTDQRYVTGCQCFQCKRWAVTLSKKPSAIYKLLRRKGWREVGGMALCDRCSQGGKLGVPISLFSPRRPRMTREVWPQ